MISKDLITELIKKYKETLSSDYALILNIRRASGENYVYDDYIFGNLNKNKVISKRNEMSFGDNVTRKMRIGDEGWVDSFCSDYRVKLLLLSKEFLYVLNINEKNELTNIEIDLSSTMFGKGTFYSYYVIEEISGNVFRITAKFGRNKELDKFIGDLDACIEKIFDLENHKEHPYQEYINMYKTTYEQLSSRTIEDILCVLRL
jgi:hypothetical protein